MQLCTIFIYILINHSKQFTPYRIRIWIGKIMPLLPPEFLRFSSSPFIPSFSNRFSQRRTIEMADI